MPYKQSCLVQIPCPLKTVAILGELNRLRRRALDVEPDNVGTGLHYRDVLHSTPYIAAIETRCLYLVVKQ